MNTVMAKQSLQTLNGAEITVKTLLNLGLTSVFGYPGGIVLDLYDELYKNQDQITHYLVRHEQAAVHAAEGYARVSGRCGVVIVTSGPGATNTVTGIANAYLDGYPLLVITGQVKADLIGHDAFQEVNILDITKSCTKGGFQVTNVKDLQKTLVMAHKLATSGKKGPVVVDISKNVFGEKTEYSETETEEFTLKDFLPSEFDIKTALNLLRRAKRPLIIAGGGVVRSKCTEELVKFSNLLNAPVVSTMMGLGAFPADSENFLGMIGIFGTERANWAIKNSDVILSLGARLNDRITGCFGDGELDGKIIQVDINPSEIGRNFSPVTGLVGDAKTVLSQMISGLRNYFGPNTGKWWSNLSSQKKVAYTEGGISTGMVVRTISRLSEGARYYVTAEVGQHQVTTAREYGFKFGGQFIASCGSGTMGFGLPASIGASIAGNRCPVICIAGDGSFQMNEQELATIVRYNLPVKIFIMNNGYLGMVRQLQEKICGGRYYETEISNPDFVKLAQAYGVNACRVERAEELEEKIKIALNTEGCYIVDILTEPFEVV